MLRAFLISNRSPVIQTLDLALRLWLGYVMVTNAGVGVTIPLESIGLDHESYSFIKALWDTGYLMHLAKAIELGAGLALLFNAWIPLALVLLVPILINIVGITAHFFPGGLFHNGSMLGVAFILMFLRKEAYQALLLMRKPALQSEVNTKLTRCINLN